LNTDFGIKYEGQDCKICPLQEVFVGGGRENGGNDQKRLKFVILLPSSPEKLGLKECATIYNLKHAL
jgi:hypothetical protein